MKYSFGGFIKDTDENGDGKVTRDELSNACEKVRAAGIAAAPGMSLLLFLLLLFLLSPLLLLPPYVFSLSLSLSFFCYYSHLSFVEGWWRSANAELFQVVDQNNNGEISLQVNTPLLPPPPSLPPSLLPSLLPSSLSTFVYLRLSSYINIRRWLRLLRE